MARTYQKKSWTKSKTQRDHEIELKLIDWVSRDPEAKYYLGVLAGAGFASLGTLLNSVGKGGAVPKKSDGTPKSRDELLAQGRAEGQVFTNDMFTDPTNPNNAAIIKDSEDRYLEAHGYVAPKGQIEKYLWLLSPAETAKVGAAAYMGMAESEFSKLQFGSGFSLSGKAIDDFINNISNMFVIGGMSFAGFCAAVLVLKALFGNDGMGEVLKGIGEIVPL